MVRLHPKNLLTPLFSMAGFRRDFQGGKQPIEAQPIKEGKHPINANGQFSGTLPWCKTAPLKRPIKRSMSIVQPQTTCRRLSSIWWFGIAHRVRGPNLFTPKLSCLNCKTNALGGERPFLELNSPSPAYEQCRSNSRNSDGDFLECISCRSPHFRVRRRGSPRFVLISPFSSIFSSDLPSLFSGIPRFVPVCSVFFRFVPICFQNKSEQIRDPLSADPFCKSPIMP